jgi:histidinol-phosphate aminotransferase
MASWRRETALPALDTADKPNIVRMRTFSKAYGMAGLRVGYLIANRALCRAVSQGA